MVQLLFSTKFDQSRTYHVLSLQEHKCVLFYYNPVYLVFVNLGEVVMMKKRIGLTLAASGAVPACFLKNKKHYDAVHFSRRAVQVVKFPKRC